MAVRRPIRYQDRGKRTSSGASSTPFPSPALSCRMPAPSRQTRCGAVPEDPAARHERVADLPPTLSLMALRFRGRGISQPVELNQTAGSVRNQRYPAMRQAILITVVATFLALPTLASNTEKQPLQRKDAKPAVHFEPSARPAPTIGQVRTRTDTHQHGASAPVIQNGDRCPCGYWLGKSPLERCPCCGLPIDREPLRIGERRD